MDLIAHLHRQAAFSKATFGPGARTKGVTDHIKKELKEVAKCYDDPAQVSLGYKHDSAGPVEITRDPYMEEKHEAAADEWTDVAILGLDGLLRAIASAHPTWTFAEVAESAASRVFYKQCKNELRDWPDWREMSEDEAIEHKRGKHD